jgi:hypothetical protein
MTDLLISFLEPQKFADEKLAREVCDDTYFEARQALGAELKQFRKQFNKQKINDGYFNALRHLLQSSKSLYEQCFEMVQSVTEFRNDLPAIEFNWVFEEPPILFSRLEESYTEKVRFQSPSLVFERCAILFLIISIQLRLLAEHRESPAHADTAHVEIQDTFRQLLSVRTLYRTLPVSESRDNMLHPALMSDHFLGNFFLSFVYSQVLMFATSASDKAESSVDQCRKAALFELSAMVLRGEVVSDAPPLICTAAARQQLLDVALERRALAFINLACVMFKQACMLTRQAANDTETALQRREKFALCDRLIDMARRCKPSQPTVAATSVEMLAHMSAIGMPFDQFAREPPIEITSHWYRTDECLDIQKLLGAVRRAHYCALSLEGTDVQIIFLGDENDDDDYDNDK